MSSQLPFRYYPDGPVDRDALRREDERAAAERYKISKKGLAGKYPRDGWVHLEDIGRDRLFRQADWNTARDKPPYYRLHLGPPFQCSSFDFQSRSDVDAFLEVCNKLRHADS